MESIRPGFFRGSICLNIFAMVNWWDKPFEWNRPVLFYVSSGPYRISSYIFFGVSRGDYLQTYVCLIYQKKVVPIFCDFCDVIPFRDTWVIGWTQPFPSTWPWLATGADGSACQRAQLWHCHATSAGFAPFGFVVESWCRSWKNTQMLQILVNLWTCSKVIVHGKSALKHHHLGEIGRILFGTFSSHQTVADQSMWWEYLPKVCHLFMWPLFWLTLQFWVWTHGFRVPWAFGFEKSILVALNE